MENKKVLMKCCICGRVKTDVGWEYQFHEADAGHFCSHGFCNVCYELEVKKIRLQAALPVMAAYP
ncbi:MAG: hypothetical protein PHP98_00595 [Kiritimatiellae bacterium]|jgi:hypothetical protein|nr:hypothetical protein [Kiritimatiellia bacterium]